ncbi:C4-dicarboxylic acid transporter DauA [Parendozoicomonas sp. Alg238-R29]|uniref:C4-dicarboxylic acid transporter DauA n=1 Tax=Parendozoicomonas sp. Alg238-R29 TaxID=2993446 RepID=UPI00248EAA0A|nr:C4-dicarboxylic acid transporter DauA [Parendozoicomonas sp. Alg238-R29]
MTSMISTALRDTFRQGYDLSRLRKDILAGMTVGIVALPLSMGLAIASGVAPEYGLYTAIVAGFLIALTGGSRVNISGPTAAFVVILLPITAKYGAGGLAVATLMAGLILMIMGLCRLGRLIEYVPYPVTIGFTSGIAVVIASLQLKDFFGLSHITIPEHFFLRISTIATSLPQLSIWDTLIAVITLGVFLIWKRLKTSVPPHLPALLIGAGTAWLVLNNIDGTTIATIGSKFSWDVDGVSGTGIPPVAPRFILPWHLPDASGRPIGISFELIRELMTSAFAIAMLGALESLLCAVVADGMTRTRHHSNGELIGQGIGNLVAPFFGGIPATAAIARTATSIRSGATSPIASIVHGVFVLLAVLLLAPLLAHIPMASLAALLLMVAWNMSEAHHFVRIVRVAPREDIAVLLTCFGLTVIFDMVIAVTIGMLLAGLLLIQRISNLSTVNLYSAKEPNESINLPSSIAIYDINGPLFFGAAQKALNALQKTDDHIQVMILDMTDVNMLDMTALVAVENILMDMQKRNIGLVLNGVQPRLLLKMRKAGIRRQKNNIAFGRNMQESSQHALTHLVSRQ